MFMGLPVRGCRPRLALRFDTKKVPNPVKEIESPRFSRPSSSSKVASMIFPVRALLSLIFLLTLATNSAFFMEPPFCQISAPRQPRRDWSAPIVERAPRHDPPIPVRDFHAEYKGRHAAQSIRQ